MSAQNSISATQGEVLTKAHPDDISYEGKPNDSQRFGASGQLNCDSNDLNNFFSLSNSTN